MKHTSLVSPVNVPLIKPLGTWAFDDGARHIPYLLIGCLLIRAIPSDSDAHSGLLDIRSFATFSTF